MFLGRIGDIFLVSLAAYTVYHGLKFTFLDKINVNKWIVFGGGVIILFITSFMDGSLTKVQSNILAGIFVMLLLWFLDLNEASKDTVKKDNTISNYHKSKTDLKMKKIKNK